MADDDSPQELKPDGQFDCPPEPLPTLRHSASHVMAEAVRRLFPDVKLAIGPAIADGFYYDFLKDEPFTPGDLDQIEAEMRKISKADHPFIREEMPRVEAIRFFESKGEIFKVEILNALDTDTVSLYRQDDFIDLCRGPHVPSTGHVRVFKLLSTSGAYWRGDERRPMLQRVYGTAWQSEEELKDYLWRLEEAKKRDHRKLGRELGLFTFHDVAPGAPFWLPKGMVLVRELERFIREAQDARGYTEISTPILVHKKLWEQSGHWEHFNENMFKLEVEDETFSLKPMNCPESTFVYRHALRSYRDLPLRLSEMGRCHRNERSGTLAGLFRARQFTQDDAHIYCRPDQIQPEIDGVLELVKSFYVAFGFDPRFYLSTKPEKGMGDPALWEQAESALAEALQKHGLSYEVKAKDGAFYGPKIDIHVSDVLKRDWQLATIQLDFIMLPERFGLEFIDVDGKPKRPVVIHRAIFGSFERFIAVLTEHFAGAFPTWLSPVQARILPVSEKALAYGRTVNERLKAFNLRAELDERNEKLGYKIREAQVEKIPYMLVVGEREAREGTASLRLRSGEDLGQLPVEKIAREIQAEVATRSVALTAGRSSA
jgi:threonyl-tRNA synthetase